MHHIIVRTSNLHRPRERATIMSTSSFPFGDDSSVESELFHQLSTTSSTVEVLVQEIEPKARELNRQLTSLLGRCPGDPEGRWVTIGRDENDEVVFQLGSIDPGAALHLVARLSEVSEILEDTVPQYVSSRPYESDLGPLVVGDAALLRQVPSTHLRPIQ